MIAVFFEYGRTRLNLDFFHGLLHLKESICMTKKKQHLLKTYTVTIPLKLLQK